MKNRNFKNLSNARPVKITPSATKDGVSLPINEQGGLVCILDVMVVHVVSGHCLVLDQIELVPPIKYVKLFSNEINNNQPAKKDVKRIMGPSLVALNLDHNPLSEVEIRPLLSRATVEVSS